MRSKANEKLQKHADKCKNWIDTTKKSIEEETKKDGASEQSPATIRSVRHTEIFYGSLRTFLALNSLAEAQLKADPSLSTYDDLDRAYNEGRLHAELVHYTRMLKNNGGVNLVTDEQFIELISILGKMIALKTMTLTSISSRRPTDK